MKLGNIHAAEEKDIIKVRNLVKSICNKMAYDNIDTIKITTAVSELTRNLYEHSSGGDIFFKITQNKYKKGLGITFKDKGPGINDLEKILSGRFKSKAGMGIGLIGAKNLMDEFQIDSSVNGTTIKMIKWFSTDQLEVEINLKEIQSLFYEISEESAIKSLQSQNREMVNLLNEIKEKNEQLEFVNRELEEKNITLFNTMEELKRSNLDILEAMTELERSKKEIEVFIETIPDGILVVDFEGNIKFANKTFLDYFKAVTNENLMIKSNFLNLKFNNILIKAIKGIVLEKKKIDLTVEPQTDKWYQIISNTVSLPKEKEPFAIILEVKDITLFVEFELMRRQFISTVSHELRTPITSINLSIKNLLRYKEKMTKEQKNSMMEMINEAAEVLIEMVEDLLILSRVDEKKLILKWTRYKLNEILERVLLQLQAKSLEKKIVIENNVSNDIYLYGDKIRINQIFRVLLDNAIKYSHENSKIILSVVDNYQGNYNPRSLNGVLIKIIDFGIGMKNKDLLYIFNRFFRCEEVHNIEGTGLGLSIAKELVESHQGNIFVESVYEEGSTFFVFLPILKRDPNLSE